MNRCCVIFIIILPPVDRRGKNYVSSEFRVVVLPRVEILLAKGLFRVHSRRHHYIILFSPNTRVRSFSCTSEHDTKPLGFDRLATRIPPYRCTMYCRCTIVYVCTHVHYALGANRKKKYL